MLQFSRLDDLQNISSDPLKIVIFEAAGSKAEGNISYNYRFHIVERFYEVVTPNNQSRFLSSKSAVN